MRLKKSTTTQKKVEEKEMKKSYRVQRSNHRHFRCPANERSLSNRDPISMTRWPVCAKSNAVYLETMTFFFVHFDSSVSHLVRIFSSVEKSKSNGRELNLVFSSSELYLIFGKERCKRRCHQHFFNTTALLDLRSNRAGQDTHTHSSRELIVKQSEFN